jgi:ElaB/YqjD/DUF883 family membrane-anchored ribosome-binding protein
MAESNNPGQGSATEQVKKGASQVGEGIRNLGEQVKETAQEKYESLRDAASDYYETGRERAQQWEEGLEGYVQDKPVKALLIAAGVGFLLGAIWKRR